MKEMLSILPETVSVHITSMHGLKAGLEEILRSTSKVVVGGPISPDDHLSEARLSRAQNAVSGVALLSHQRVEHLFQQNHVAVRAAKVGKRRDLWSYISSLDAL